MVLALRIPTFFTPVNTVPRAEVYQGTGNLLRLTFFVKVSLPVVYRLRAIRSSPSNLRRGMTRGLSDVRFEMLG
jgi:hypothetical protein